MYNFSFNSVLPFTAAISGFDRLLNGLAGIILIPLFVIAGLLAFDSDFNKMKAIDGNNFVYSFESEKSFVFNNIKNHGTVRPDNSGSVGYGSGESGQGQVWGKGMMLMPMIDDDLLPGGSLNKHRVKINRTAFDKTIYLSVDEVDQAPELIWMVYPDLSKSGIGNSESVQVTLSILVDYSGKPVEVTITDESGIDHSAKQILLESARASVFRPAQKNSQSVSCWVQIPLSLEVGV